MEPIRPNPLIAINLNRIDSRSAQRLAIAMISAMQESVSNIQLASLGEVASETIWGVIKGKFGFFLSIPMFAYHLANRDWKKIQELLFDEIMGAVGVDDLIAIYQAINRIDNGVAAVAIMKDPDYKAAIKKLD